jgi:hypothetical protein
MIKWDRYVPGANSDYTYQGHTLPRVIESGDWEKIAPRHDQWGHPVKRAFWVSQRSGPTSAYRQKNKCRITRSIPIEQVPNTLWVANFVPEFFNNQHRLKLVKYVEDNNLNLHQFAACMEGAPVSPFIPAVNIVEWEEIKKLRLEKRTPYQSSGRIPGSYDVYTEDTTYSPNGYATYGKGGVPGGDLRPVKEAPLYYLRGNLRVGQKYAAMLHMSLQKFTLVCLPSNRIAKFTRDAPAAIDVVSVVTPMFTKWKDALTTDEIACLAMIDNCYHRDRMTFAGMDANNFDDPALQESIRVAKLPQADALTKTRAAFSGIVPRNDLRFTWADPTDAYPLWSHTADNDHLAIYANAAYAAA